MVGMGVIASHLSSVGDYLLQSFCGGWSPVGVGVGWIVLCFSLFVLLFVAGRSSFPCAIFRSKLKKFLKL